MTNKPTVSIITPVYNCEAFLGATVESVLNQTFQDWELLIIDDRSSDNSLVLARAFEKRDARIRVIPLDDNHGGPGFARNKGILWARGKYVSFIDSDDLWLPHKLERQVEFMQRTGAAFSYHYYRRMNENGDTWGGVVKAPNQVTYENLLGTNPIGCLTAMIDIEKVGRVQSIEHQPEDFALWLKILKNGHVGYCLKEELAHYRIVKGSFSRNKIRAALSTMIFFRKVEGVPYKYIPKVYLTYIIQGIVKNFPILIQAFRK